MQTPILVSLVNRDAGMLDAFGKGASEDIIQSKQTLYQLLTLDPSSNESLCTPLQIPLQYTSPPLSPSNMDGGVDMDGVLTGNMHSEVAAEELRTPAPTVDHMPEHPLKLLQELEAALCLLVDAVRMLLLNNSKEVHNNLKEERKFYSAMLQDPGEYEQVRSSVTMPSKISLPCQSAFHITQFSHTSESGCSNWSYGPSCEENK